MENSIQNFSINAAAEILERDRRTITKALRHVPPDADGRWRMSTIVNALMADKRGITNPARARLLAAQAKLAEQKLAALDGSLLDAAEVEATWSSFLRAVRAELLAVPSRAAARLPHLTAHDLSEIDAEIRDALTSLGNGDKNADLIGGEQ